MSWLKKVNNMKYLFIVLIVLVSCVHKVEPKDSLDLPLSSCFIEVCREGVVCRYKIIGTNHERYIVKYNEQTQNHKLINEFIRSYVKSEFNNKVRSNAGVTDCSY